MTSARFGRTAIVEVGPLRFATQFTGSDLRKDNLKITFEVERTGSQYPNAATLAIYNLSPSTRARLQAADQPACIEAGYGDDISSVFSGQTDKVEHRRDGTDWVSVFELKDASASFKDNRIFRSYAPGTPRRTVFRDVAQAMGVGLGNLTQVTSGQLRGGQIDFPQGYAVGGLASREFDNLMNSAGFAWTIQDGEIVLSKPGEPPPDTGPTIPVIRAGSGLLQIPEIGEDGVVKFTAQLDTRLRPPRKIDLRSEIISGTFKAERCVHRGDTRGGDWITEVEAKAAT